MSELYLLLLGFVLGIITASVIFYIQFSRLRNEINELNMLLYETQKELERAKNMPELEGIQMSFADYVNGSDAPELVEGN